MEHALWERHFAQFPPLAYLPFLLAQVGILMQGYMSRQGTRVDIRQWMPWLPPETPKEQQQRQQAGVKAVLQAEAKARLEQIKAEATDGS